MSDRKGLVLTIAALVILTSAAMAVFVSPQPRTAEKISMDAILKKRPKETIRL